MAQTSQQPWNKGRLIGQKPPLKLKDIWTIRIHLQNANATRDLALFNLAIDSKLRGCDLISLGLKKLGLTQPYTEPIHCGERRQR